MRNIENELRLACRKAGDSGTERHIDKTISEFLIVLRQAVTEQAIEQLHTSQLRELHVWFVEFVGVTGKLPSVGDVIRRFSVQPRGALSLPERVQPVGLSLVKTY